MADDNECKVYVGSLSFKTEDDDLENFFNDCGVVKAQVIKDRETGRSRGFGFVTFQDYKGFEKALELNGEELDGRKVTVSKANARTGGGGGGRSGGGAYRGGRRDYGQDRGGGQYRGGGSGYEGRNYGGGGGGGAYGGGGGYGGGGAYGGGGGYGSSTGGYY